MDTDYMRGDPQDEGYISSDFQWEHRRLGDEKGIMLTCIDVNGDDVSILFDYQAMDEFMVGAEDYFNYLKEDVT